MIDIKDYVVIDLEMTGLSAKYHKVIEIGAVRIRNGQVVETLELLVNPKCPIPEKVVELTGITDEMVATAFEEDIAMATLLDFMGEDIIIGQNVNFDYSFIKQWEVNKKIKVERKGCDTLKIARYLLPPEQPKKLEGLCEYFQIPRPKGHRALEDALQTAMVFERLKEMAGDNPKLAVYFEPKTLMYHAKKQTPATARQIERLKEYRHLHDIKDGIVLENMTRSEASRLMDKYIVTYGR